MENHDNDNVDDKKVNENRNKKRFFKPNFRDAKKEQNNDENSEDINHAKNRFKKWDKNDENKNDHHRRNFHKNRANKNYKHHKDLQNAQNKESGFVKDDIGTINDNERFSSETLQENVKRISNPDEKGNLSFHRDLRDGVIANHKIQKHSLNAHYKLDLNTKAKVRITPLGGLGEIGGNMTIFETDNCAIVVDIGMSFPDEDMHGIDILIPNFSYIEQIKHKIAGVVITHAHEDHIGAVPYFYKLYNFPLYGTPLSLSLVGNKFDEHGLRKCKELFRIIEKRTPVKIGDFEIEWIHITHSIIDSSALAIKTDAGVILHTGDFKIDHTPVDHLPTDLHRLAHYGEQGVLLLMSDSTNSHKSGVTPSESSVGPTFDSLFKSAKGRVIMSTFSSNIHRVYQAIKYGMQYNRKVAVIGRSMEKNIDIARELEYIDIPNSNFIEAHEINNYDDNEILIVTTGSQGETMSALYRMATDEHRHVKLKDTDMVILSAKAIPGNESGVSSVINLIMKAGAKVAYQDFSEIHVSGHAAKEEQKLMLRLIKPKFFLPVHGEYNHIAKHKETAISCGIPEENIILMEDGDQIEVNPNYMRKVRKVKTGKTYIDNQINKIIDNEIVAQRNVIANNGILIISLRINFNANKIIESKINCYGLVNKNDEKDFKKSVFSDIKMRLDAIFQGSVKMNKSLEVDLDVFLRRIMFKKFKKYPMITINIFGRERNKNNASKAQKNEAIDTNIESNEEIEQKSDFEEKVQ